MLSKGRRDTIDNCLSCHAFTYIGWASEVSQDSIERSFVCQSLLLLSFVILRNEGTTLLY
jgi:hypothetical protein